MRYAEGESLLGALPARKLTYHPRFHLGVLEGLQVYCTATDDNVGLYDLLGSETLPRTGTM